MSADHSFGLGNVHRNSRLNQWFPKLPPAFLCIPAAFPASENTAQRPDPDALTSEAKLPCPPKRSCVSRHAPCHRPQTGLARPPWRTPPACCLIPSPLTAGEERAPPPGPAMPAYCSFAGSVQPPAIHPASTTNRHCPPSAPKKRVTLPRPSIITWSRRYRDSGVSAAEF